MAAIVLTKHINPPKLKVVPMPKVYDKYGTMAPLTDPLRLATPR